MILKKLKFQKNGEVESVWMINQEQYHALLNFAVNALLAQGTIAVEEVDEKDLEEEAGEPEYDAMKQYLENVKKEDLPQA